MSDKEEEISIDFKKIFAPLKKKKRKKKQEARSESSEEDDEVTLDVDSLKTIVKKYGAFLLTYKHSETIPPKTTVKPIVQRAISCALFGSCAITVPIRTVRPIDKPRGTM